MIRLNIFVIWRFSASKCFNFRSSHQDVFLGKVFWKYSANWKENTHAECKATFLKSHFCMGFLLSICCIFSEHLFFKKTSGWLHLLFLSYLGQNFLMLLGYFNTTPEVFKVIQSDRTSDYITKNEFHSVPVIFL